MLEDGRIDRRYGHAGLGQRGPIQIAPELGHDGTLPVGTNANRIDASYHRFGRRSQRHEDRVVILGLVHDRQDLAQIDDGSGLLQAVAQKCG